MTAQQLVDACRAVAAAGLSPGSSGNASVRIGDRVLITPTGSSLRRVTAGDVVELALDGAHVAGPAPTKEWALHVAAYRVRPDARAVIHLHSRAATAVSCLACAPGADPLPPYTPYRLRTLGRVRLVDYAAPGSDALARGVADAAADAHVLLLANHGSVVCAPDLERAVDLCEELEAAAELALTLHGRAARLLDPTTAWTG
ncbi:class II aldolase/adducin family protein [Microbacterium timonense]|uniref:class II aldolase/adducin family protein n=1 Tax=Microbacterium timonense TaxID=2086576 RepID=UPI000D109C84|nr:class II aldolase/adducin family protein [Microbacterium timonense]